MRCTCITLSLGSVGNYPKRSGSLSRHAKITGSIPVVGISFFPRFSSLCLFPYTMLFFFCWFYLMFVVPSESLKRFLVSIVWQLRYSFWLSMFLSFFVRVVCSKRNE
ncbi:hypothetical protein QR685DRAFT_185709 [Neurospora intermedia]|uniref:Uncharacterized protein n=1 Tax=Neurospora intermedia TaxID=5142 RepID=A0ABR3DM90_NEUIN